MTEPGGAGETEGRRRKGERGVKTDMKPETRPESDEDEDYEWEKRKSSLGGAAITPDVKDKELPQDFPYEEEQNLYHSHPKLLFLPQYMRTGVGQDLQLGLAILPC